MSFDPLGGLSGASTGASIGSLVPGIGTGLGAVAGGLIGAFGGAKKVKAPPPPTGTQSGQWAKDYYDTAFAGTTPWERLGTSNPSGQVMSGAMSTQTEANVAEEHNRTTRKQINLNNLLESGRLINESKRTDIEKDKVDIEIAKLPSEIQKNRYSSISSALKSLSEDNPELFKAILVGGGLSGVAGIAGKGISALLNLKKIKNLKEGTKFVNPNTIKEINKANKFNKGYKNPYTGKKVTD